jgi:predicted PurR-regulated permease PerM
MIMDTERDRFVRLLFYVIVLLVGYLAYLVVRPFIGSLAWAAVFAMLLAPICARLTPRFGRAGAALVTTFLAVVLVIGPVTTVTSVVAKEATRVRAVLSDAGYGSVTPARIQEVWEALRSRLPFDLPVDLSSEIRSGLETVAAFLASSAGAFVANIAGALFQLFVMLFALFFLLRDSDSITARIRDLLPFEPARRDRILLQTYDLVIASIGASFAIALVQGLLGGLTFWLLGFASPVFMGVLTAFFALLPAIGSWVVWMPAAIWLFASGDVTRGLILTGVGVGVIGMVDNVLRPVLLSGRAAMSGLVIFIGLLGGVAAFGFIGLVLGPVILVTAGTLLDAGATPVTPAPDERSKENTDREQAPPS